MRNKKRTCSHILTNGEICRAIPLRDSNFCYWHHKARARLRRYERIGGPISAQANSGVQLPLLEDANAIQVAVQEIMQAILDRRIDNKRAGLLLYSIQLASQNLQHLHTIPNDHHEQIAEIGDDDEQSTNDCIGEDPRDELCDGDCHQCVETGCEDRTEPAAPKRIQRKPPASEPKLLPPQEPQANPLSSAHG